MAENLQWTIGAVQVTRVFEQPLYMVPSELFPSASPDAMARHTGWLEPWAVDHDGRLVISIHALCVEADGQKIVVDTCFGPGPFPETMKSMEADASFLAELTSTGFGRDDVDLVICTHLHIDHVGWNTIDEDGTRVPTFWQARYLLAKPEYEHWHVMSEDARRSSAASTFDSCVTPLFEHGVVDLVDPDHRVSDAVRLLPTPGHSPGHVSVVISSLGDTALITGDCTHSPVQFAEPTWFSLVDSDTDLSAATRRHLIAQYADTRVLVIGTHFPPPTAGHLVTTGTTVQFRPLS